MSEITKQFILETTGRELNDDQYNKFMDLYNSRKTGLVGDLGNQMKAGALRGLASGQLLFGDYEGAAENIQGAQVAADADPDLARRMAAVPNADSIFKTLLNMGADPKAAAGYIAQSLPGSLASGVAALPTGRGARALGIAAKPVAAATFGVGSAIQEYGSAAFQVMAEAGVDITNPDEIEAVLTDPDIGPQIKGYAAKKGIPVGVFDAISFGIAGKLLPEGKATIGGLAAETGVQAGLGGAGAAAGQLLSDGEISDWGEIGLEIGLEGITGAPQAVIQPAMERLTGVSEGAPTGSKDPFQGFIDSLRNNRTTGEAPVIEDAPATETPATTTEAEEFAKDRVAAEAKRAEPTPIKAPREILRGTPKQMKTRLMALSKEELRQRAVDYAQVDAASTEGKTKGELVDLIFGNFGIDATRKDDVQTPRAAKMAAEPTVTTASVAPSNKLPDSLAGSKPRYRNFEPQFESDIDKALFIISQKEKSAKDSEFVDWLQKTTGMSRSELDAAATQVRNTLKAESNRHDNSQGGAFKVPASFTVAEKPTPATQASQALPQELQQIDKDTRAELAKVANAAQESPSRNAADKWLQGLPDNVTLNTTLKGASKIKNYNPRGAVLETLNTALTKYNRAKGKRPDTAKRAVGEALKSLRNSGFFTSKEASVFDGPTDELVDYANKKYNFGDKEVTKQFLSKPRVRENVISDYVHDSLAGTKPSVSSPLLDNITKRLEPVFASREEYSPAEKAIMDRGAKPETVAPEAQVQENAADNSEITTYEAVDAIRENADRISEELFKKPDYEKNMYELAASSPNAGAIQSLLNKYDVFRSMASLARKYPILNPLYQLYKDRDAFRHNIATSHLMHAKLLTQKYGTPRTDKALEILDAMSRPNQKGGAQVIVLGEDGRIKYTDFDGKSKYADPQTSDAVKEWSELFKSDVSQKMQAIITELKDYGIDPQTGTRADIVETLRQLRGTGNDTAADAIQSNLEILDRLEGVYNSNKAYYPHNRNRGGEGKYAIATYTRNDEGGYDLAGLYPVKKDAFGRIDREDERAVRERIQNDENTYGVQFFTSKGNAVSTSQPFALTSNSLRNAIMKNAKDPNIAYEALSSLLSHKGIDPNEINKVFDDLQLRNNTERLFTNLRERGGYYGYDNEDRLSSVVDNLVHQAGVLTSYKYTPKITQYYTVAANKIGEQGPVGEPVLKILKKYTDYMVDPREEWAALRGMNFWYFLAGNPSTALLQLMSTYQNTLPWLSQYTSPLEFMKANVKSVANITGPNGKARKFVMNQGLLTKPTMDQFIRQTGIDRDTARILLDLKNGGLLDPQYGIEAIGDLGIDATGRVQNRRTRAQQALGAAKDLPSKLIQVPEVIARVNSALLIADTLKDQGQFTKIGNLLYRTDPSFKNMIDIKYDGRITKEGIIRHAIEENHAVFGKSSRSPFMRGGPAALLFPFLTYPVQIMEQYGRLLTQRGIEGKRAAAMMVLFYPILFGGLMAVPGYETWDWMTKWFTQLAQQRNTTLEIEISRALGDMGVDPSVSRKLLSGFAFDSANIDASARIGNQFFFQPFLDSLLNPNEGPLGAQTNADFLGGASALLTGARDAGARIKEGDDPLRAIGSTMSPIALRNLFKAGDIARGEVASTKGDRLLPSPEENPDVWGAFGSKDEALLQMVGLRPSLISEASKRRFQQTLLDKGEQGKMTTFYANLARQAVEMHKAKAAGNREEFNEARKGYMEVMKELVRANAASDQPKTAKELARGIKSSLKGRVDQELNPLKTQKHLGKGRNAKEDMRTLSLPRMEQFVQDR